MLNTSQPNVEILTQQSSVHITIFFLSVQKLHLVVETDYDNWALLVECRRSSGGRGRRGGGGRYKYDHVRILTRDRSVPQPEIDLIASLAQQSIGVTGNHAYNIDQEGCPS